MKYAVLYPDLIQSHDRGGGARTTPMVVPSVGATTFINGITEFDPGTAIPFHSHNCEESVILLSGHAYLDIDGDVHELKPLDTTFIPPNVPHRFRNKSDVEPMKILWIYASVNATRTLMESGETRAVAAEHAK
ncbi:cupin domain-containing protein [Burkholderia cenocepacia]|nr:cupin domain-containing protein [Burkholderia cenocepacia]MDF3079813.1 cupin domain-containing protein [Burkholderia sola]